MGVRLAGGSKSLCPQWRGRKHARGEKPKKSQDSARPALPNRPGRAVHAGNPPPETRRAVRWPLGTRESRTETERPCAPQIRPRKRRADQEPRQGLQRDVRSDEAGGSATKQMHCRTLPKAKVARRSGVSWAGGPCTPGSGADGCAVFTPTDAESDRGSVGGALELSGTARYQWP